MVRNLTLPSKHRHASHCPTVLVTRQLTLKPRTEPNLALYVTRGTVIAQVFSYSPCLHEMLQKFSK